MIDKFSSHDTPQPEPDPWWRHAMVWLVIAGPLAVIVAGFATLWIAVSHPDPIVADDSQGAGAYAPAQQARNHAAGGR